MKDNEYSRHSGLSGTFHSSHTNDNALAILTKSHSVRPNAHYIAQPTMSAVNGEC